MRRALLFPAVLSLVSVACGGSAVGTTAQGDANACPASTAPLSGSVASGSLNGASVAADVCNATIPALTPGSGSSAPVLRIQGGSVQFATPDAATSTAGMNAGFELPSPTAGTYDEEQSCGAVSVEYVLPIPAGVDCGGPQTTGPSCPPGCTSSCDDSGCGPCNPAQPTGRYLAYFACPDDLEPSSPVGHWTLTLSSVEPDANGDHGYVAHGTLDAQLFGGTGDASSGEPNDGAQPASLSLRF